MRCTLALALLATTVALAGHDVGVSRILSPSYELRGRGPFGPSIAFYNYGTEIERDVPVWCWIDSGGVRMYEGSANEMANVWPQHELWVDNFPLWYPTPGYYPCSVTAFTALPNDENRANDTMRGSCTLVLSHYQAMLMSQVSPLPPEMDGQIGGFYDPYSPESEISDTAGRAGVVRPHGSCLVCVVHTDTAYIAVDAIMARTREDGDRVVIKFDENNDGVWAADSSEGTYTAFINGGIDSLVYSWLPGQQCPGGRSVSSTTSGNLQFEMAIPIGIQRSDLTVDGGSDLSGCAISFWRGDSCYGWWPQSLEFAQWDDPQYFGDYYWVSFAVQEERHSGSAQSAATVIRGVLRAGHDRNPPGDFGPCPKRVLLDASGRKVMCLRSGTNDVSHLAAGVYFLRQAQAQAVQKVVVTR